jgi:hypothetical protein
VYGIVIRGNGPTPQPGWGRSAHPDQCGPVLPDRGARFRPTDEGFLWQAHRRAPISAPYFDLSKKRFVAISEVDKILQQAYGDADDFDDVVHLEHTINEEQLRSRVSTSLERLKRLGTTSYS